MDSFEECIEALGEQAIILENKEIQELVTDKMEKSFPITSWGRINWEKVNKKITIQSVYDLIPLLKKTEKKVAEPIYIVWDDAGIPLIKSKLEPIIKNIDDVTAVSFDTWLYCPSEGWIVEFHHDGEITLGFE